MPPRWRVNAAVSWLLQTRHRRQTARSAGEVTLMAELSCSAGTCSGHILSTTDRTWGSNSGLCAEKPVSKRPHHSRALRSPKLPDFSRLSSDLAHTGRPLLFTDIVPVVFVNSNLSKTSLHRTYIIYCYYYYYYYVAELANEHLSENNNERELHHLPSLSSSLYHHYHHHFIIAIIITLSSLSSSLYYRYHHHFIIIIIITLLTL